MTFVYNRISQKVESFLTPKKFRRRVVSQITFFSIAFTYEEGFKVENRVVPRRGKVLTETKVIEETGWFWFCSSGGIDYNCPPLK